MYTQDLYTQMLIELLFIIARCPTDEWVNKCGLSLWWKYLAIKCTDTCYKDEAWKHYSEWKNPDTEGYILYDSIYMKCVDWQSIKTKEISSYQDWRED